MKLKHFLLVFLSLTFVFSNVNAQKNKNFTCSHDEMQEKYWQQNPAAKNEYLELFNNSKTFEIQQGKKRTKFIIPVVFHVIHNNGEENLSDQDIIKHLKIVNQHYQKLNKDTIYIDPAFKDIIANCNFEFRLAAIDPKGNCTSGIIRKKSVLTNNADDYSKFEQWDRKKYLNIWIVKNFPNPSLGGYSNYPTAVLGYNFFTDGVILRADSFFDFSTVLTHEIGHFLGLRHTFNSDKYPNSTGIECGDDGISDTPSTRGKAYKSGKNPNATASNSKNYRDSICGLDTTIIINNFEGVTKSSGNIDAKSNIYTYENIPLIYQVTNFRLDTINDAPAYPRGSKIKFIYRNLSAESTLKSKISYSNWPLGGTNNDTLTSKYSNNIDTNKYYQFEYTSSSGNSVDLKGLNLTFGRNREGIKSLSIRSSLDNFKSNLPLSTTDKLIRIINNTANFKSDTTKSMTLSVDFNTDLFTDFRDGKKVSFRIYGWNAESLKGSFLIDTIYIKANSFKFKSSGLKAFNLSNNSSTNGKFAFSNWPIGGIDKDTLLVNQTGALNPSKYYEFTIQPYKRKLLNVDSINFIISRNFSGVKSFSIKSSVDNYGADLSFTTKSKLIQINNNIGFIKRDTTLEYEIKIDLSKNLSFSDIRNNKPLTFRIYGWNAENSDGTLELDSLRLYTVASSIENIDNFMDYSIYNKMFTLDQSKLMTSFLLNPKSIRYNLVSEENIKNTGVMDLTTPICKPVAYFYSNTKYACTDDQISFYDRSWNSVVESRIWKFEDANIETSNLLDPKVSFKTPGFKKVTLIVSNSKGESDTITETVLISNKTAENQDVFKENFENGIPSNWLIENYENNEVEFKSDLGRWGSKGVKLNNYKNVSNATPLDENDYFYYQRLRENQDALVTPSVNFKIINEGYLNFDYSYATSGYSDSLITEKINIKYTDDCGKTWKSLTTKDLKSELITAGIYGAKEFIPTKDEFWKTATIDLKSLTGKENVRFKIEFISSKNSNNLFIDNVNLFGVVGIEENPLNVMNFNIVPNPTSNDKGINIEYTANDKPVKFELIDLQGKILKTESNQTTNSAISHTLTLNNQLESGYYTLRISQEQFVFNKKLIVQ